MLLKKTKIAIAGVGTVGSGVIELIKKKSIQKKFGIEVTAIASRRKIKKPELGSRSITFFNNAERIIDFDDYDKLSVAITNAIKQLKQSKNINFEFYKILFPNKNTKSFKSLQKFFKPLSLEKILEINF